MRSILNTFAGRYRMAIKTGLGYSPLTERVYWGRQNTKTGLWIGNNKKDVTSEFLQVMEHKFPINTQQNISVNGENKYCVIVVDMEKKPKYSAAPELLEALEAAMDFINKHPADPDINNDQAGAYQKLQALNPQALINKAKGQ